MNKQPRWQQPEWKKFRLKVLKRDNYTCQDCGVKQKKGLNVHEKKYEYPFKMKNCITYCFECHRKNDEEFDLYMNLKGVVGGI